MFPLYSFSASYKQAHSEQHTNVQTYLVGFSLARQESNQLTQAGDAILPPLVSMKFAGSDVIYPLYVLYGASTLFENGFWCGGRW